MSANYKTETEKYNILRFKCKNYVTEYYLNDHTSFSFSKVNIILKLKAFNV